MNLRPAIFLDRDGTLNRQVVRDGKPYPPATVGEFTLFDGVAEQCLKLERAGYFLVVATNQPDVGRRTQTREAVEAMHASLQRSVPSIQAVKVCYHAGTDYGEPCSCRKPKPGMLTDAAHEYGLDLKRSWMIGDRWRDIDCGAAAGARTIFLDWGYTEQLRATPDFTVKSFAEAAGIVLAHPFL